MPILLCFFSGTFRDDGVYQVQWDGTIVGYLTCFDRVCLDIRNYCNYSLGFKTIGVARSHTTNVPIYARSATTVLVLAQDYGA